MKPLYLIAILGILFMVYPAPSRTKTRPNPRKGGWSKKKIAKFNKKTGSKLKAGVDHDPKSLEDFKRKGSWAVRHYKRIKGPDKLNKAKLTDSKGNLTPFSTQAMAWGERPPKTRAAQKRLVKLGEKLLETYKKYKDLGYKKKDALPVSVRKKFKKSLTK